jgi:hypothetical protein
MQRRVERMIERHGGVLLVIVGISLIGLATWQAVHSAVASVFAFCGVAMVVLGVVLERMEGAFELAPTGLKATLSAAQQLEIREDLTLEEKADELLALLRHAGLTTTPAEPAKQKTTTVSDGEDSSSPRIFPALEPYVVRQRSATTGLRFEQFVAAAFRATGWEVKPEVRRHGWVLDFEARREGLTIYVECKLMRARFGAADAAHFLAAVQPENAHGALCILVVPTGSLTANARDTLLRAPNVHVLEAPVIWDDQPRD